MIGWLRLPIPTGAHLPPPPGAAFVSKDQARKNANTV